MLTAGELKNWPSTVGDAPVHREDKGADPASQRVEMVEESADLIEGVLILYVAVGFGFGDEKVCTPTVAVADDVGPVAADERRNGITGRILKVRADRHTRMAFPYGTRGGKDKLTMLFTLRHLGADREGARQGRSGHPRPGRRYRIAGHGGRRNPGAGGT